MLPIDLQNIITRIYLPQYDRAKKQGGDPYCSANTIIGLELLSDLYNKSLETKQVPAIETLSKEQKDFYWLLAKKYYTDQGERIKAAKACFMLDVLMKDETDKDDPFPIN